LPFIDGDDYHPKANIDKMKSKEELTDDDRYPWLEIIRTRAREICVEQLSVDSTSLTVSRAGVVVACSALKKKYRNILRGHVMVENVPAHEHLEPPRPDELSTYFVFIKGERDVLMERMLKREGHFMKAEMLDSQLKTLESPEGEENVVVVSMDESTEDQVRMAREGLNKFASGCSL